MLGVGEIADCLPDYCRCPILILGCGNILRGDDGFGPEVVAYLQEHFTIPEDVALMDAGTSVSEILLDIVLSEHKPERMLLIDAMENGLTPGTVSFLPIERIEKKSIKRASSHQTPTSRSLQELRELSRIAIMVLTVEPEVHFSACGIWTITCGA